MHEEECSLPWKDTQCFCPVQPDNDDITRVLPFHSTMAPPSPKRGLRAIQLSFEASRSQSLGFSGSCFGHHDYPRLIVPVYSVYSKWHYWTWYLSHEPKREERQSKPWPKCISDPSFPLPKLAWPAQIILPASVASVSSYEIDEGCYCLSALCSASSITWADRCNIPSMKLRLIPKDAVQLLFR